MSDGARALIVVATMMTTTSVFTGGKGARVSLLRGVLPGRREHQSGGRGRGGPAEVEVFK